MRRGCFITFEGPEGSGKSSQAKWLAAALRRRGHRVVLVRDPGSTAIGRRLRRVLLHVRGVHIAPATEALLFIAGRIQLAQELIRPALRRGYIVICDRFHDSTVAYQGFGGPLDVEWLDRLGRQAIGNLMPDLTMLLDVPTTVGFQRLRHRRDRMEQKAQAFHRAVRRGFLTLARRQPRRFVVLDATTSQPRLRQEMLLLVMRKLSHH
jgi:dTMP kinase